MSHESTIQSWTLEEWKQLSEHPSPFVRLWVAESAPDHVNCKYRSDLLRMLLEDENLSVRHNAEMDLLQTPFPQLADWYLHIALRESSHWGQIRSALQTLATIGDQERLISWLEEIHKEFLQGDRDPDSVLHHLLCLPGHLARMDLSRAEPVAERCFQIFRDLLDQEPSFLWSHNEELMDALVGLLFSHPTPRDIFDVLAQVDAFRDMALPIAELVGDDNWIRGLFQNGEYPIPSDNSSSEKSFFDRDIFGDGDMMNDGEATEEEDDFDPEEHGLEGIKLHFLEWHLTPEFVEAWGGNPDQRPALCLQQAERIVRDALPTSDEARLPWAQSDDFSRMERAHTLLKILADPDLPNDARPNDLEWCALLLVVLLFSGRTCLGRTEEDFSPREMLSVLAEDRPDMLQDRRFLSRLESGATDCDPSFREMLLEHSRSGLSEFPAPWSKRVLGLAPDYGLQELVPEIMQLVEQQEERFSDEDLDFLEDILTSLGSAQVWREYLKQNPDMGSPLPGAEEFSTEMKKKLWRALFYVQKIPCPEALDWLETNLHPLIRENETEVLGAIESSADPRFIPALQPFLAQDEDKRWKIFHTLCQLHGDSRALSPEEENGLWEKQESRQKQLFERISLFMGDHPLPHPQLSDREKERVQLCCDSCQGVFHYHPERIVVYESENEDQETAADIGGEIVCKACGASVDHLRVTPFGRFLLMNGALRKVTSSSLDKDLQILRGGTDSGKQILVCPPGQGLPGEPFSSFREGLEQYEHDLASDPGNPSLCVGRADLLKKLLRFREAESYYRDALQGDPGCLEAMEALYELCKRRDKDEEAWEWLQRAYETLSTGTVYRADPNNLKTRIAQTYVPEASKRGMAPAEPQKSRKHRVKRNDPCPCGSGKKYKKCCLEK